MEAASGVVVVAVDEEQDQILPAQSQQQQEEDDPANCDDKTSIVSIVCRICFDDNKDETIITPCKCKGTVAFVHKTCLEKWLSESNSTACELCHHVYETERVPKYTAKQSIWKWFRHQPSNFGARVRAIRCDLIVCAVLTPFAIVITYICLFSADYYNQQRFSNIPTARWTSISLLIMIAIMLFGYYIWVYVVVGYHGRMWYYWWQRECIVRYIPPEPDQPNYPLHPPPSRSSQQQQQLPSSTAQQHLQVEEINGDSVMDLSISRSDSNAASDETAL